MKMRKVLVLLLALTILLPLVVGCNASQTSTTTASSGSTTGTSGTTSGTSAASKAIINYHLGATPETLDPQKNNATDGACVIQHCFEGLTTKNEKNQIVPGMAESWTTSTDGLTWTFKLRDATWSDGVAVKAKDFIFAWQRACDPEVDYSYQMTYLKNADEIIAGTITDKTQLGVKATDDKTLVVTLKAPCAYFTQLTAFPTYFPVREDVAKEGWANNPATYICNGPYTMTAFVPKSEIILEQNKKYYNAASLPGIKLSFKLTDDDSAALAAFETGELDICESLPPSETKRMQEKGVYHVEPIVGTYFYCVNVEGDQAILKDVKFRKALALAINRDRMIEVAQNDALPAYAFVPKGMPEPDGKDFREKGGNYFGSGDYDKDVLEAQALLKEIGHEMGAGIPTLTLIYNTNEGHKLLAETVQAMWKDKLGLKIKLENQEWAVFQETRNKGNFQLARHGWLGDYNDPMTFLDMWLSNSGQNDANWKNSEFDAYIETARTSVDETVRMDAMHKAEALLMTELPILPVYYYTNVWLDNGKIKNYVHDNLIGHMMFIWATKAE